MTDLATAYREVRPAAEHSAASGCPVIGIVGRDVPAVLVAAAGALPFRILPEEQQTDEADAVMGRALDRSASLVLAALLSGSLDFLRGIFVAHDNEASLRLFYTVQELHRRGRIAVPVQLVDQVHLVRESTLRFNATQLSLMSDTASAWTSMPIDANSVEVARAEQERLHAELRGMRDARRRGGSRVAGLTALHAYAVAGAASPSDALAAVARDTSAPANDRFPVFLTGSAPIGDGVYRAIEAAGADVVGEDHDWGDPILTDILPAELSADREQLMRELASSRLNGAPASASSSMAARAEYTREGIRASGARALLSVVRSHDDAPAWDWRHQRPLAGVPGLQLRGPGADDAERIAEAILTLRSES